jgi:hypothetical protein
VSELISDSLEQRDYRLNGTELTEAIVDKFATAVDRQTYLLQYSRDAAIQEMNGNMQRFDLERVGIANFITHGTFHHGLCTQTSTFAIDSGASPAIEPS